MTESDKYREQSYAYTSCNVDIDPTARRKRVNPSEKSKIQNWFIEPLKKLGGDDSIVCLMILFPLLEKILRHDLKVPSDQDLTFSDNSPALKQLAKLISIPESDARKFWDCFRNGLLHRGMVKGDFSYTLDPSTGNNRAAKVVGDEVTVFIWDFRDLVIELLKDRGTKMWKDGEYPLPDVH